MTQRHFCNFPASEFMTDFEIIHLSRENIRVNNLRHQNQPEEPQVEESGAPDTLTKAPHSNKILYSVRRQLKAKKVIDEAHPWETEQLPELEELQVEQNPDSQDSEEEYLKEEEYLEDTLQGRGGILERHILSQEIPLPEINEDTHDVNVRHISINIDVNEIEEVPENQILNISDLNVFHDQHLKQTPNSQEKSKVEDNKDSSSDTLKDSNSSESTIDNSNTSFISAVESPSTSSSPSIPLREQTELGKDEIEHLQRLVHSNMKIRNNDTQFVNILNIANNLGPIISAVSPNFGVSYLNDYFVCHICNSNLDKNPSWNQDQDTHPCVKTVAGMFVHLHKYHCQKLGIDRELTVPAEKFIREQVIRLQHGISNHITDTKESIPKSASTSMMDNSWTYNDLEPNKTLIHKLKHVFDDTSCNGHSVIEISKDAEFYDLANSIYCTCNQESLDKTTTKLVNKVPSSPSFSMKKSVDRTHRTLLGAAAIKGFKLATIPKKPHKSFPIGKPRTRSDTRSDDSDKLQSPNQKEKVAVLEKQILPQKARPAQKSNPSKPKEGT